MTEDRKRLIDGPAGMWCVQLGYGNTEIADAMAQQAKEMAYFSPFNNANSAPARLAHEITKRTPGDLNHVFFTTGGSTAVDSAIRIVQFRNNLLGKPEKKIVISRQKAYHGSTYLAASASGKERDKGWLDQASDLTRFLPNVNPYTRRPDQTINDFLDEKIADLENTILQTGADKVAAFIAEPILCSGGVIVPPRGIISAAWKSAGNTMSCIFQTRSYPVLVGLDIGLLRKTSLEFNLISSPAPKA